MSENTCLEKQPLCDEMLQKMDTYWRAANYLSAGQLYLLDNPLLRKPLTMDHVKKKIVGHWGTVPGQNFVWTHCCLLYTSYSFSKAEAVFTSLILYFSKAETTFSASFFEEDNLYSFSQFDFLSLFCCE